MEILFNFSGVLLRIEILLFFVSLLYTFYYIFDRFFIAYRQVKDQKREKQVRRKKILEKQKNISKKPKAVTSTFSKESTKSSVTHNNTEKLRDTIKRVQINKERGYYDTARSLIIEGLAIDKNNRDLNLELWEVYELEENYKNAEYIYKDMLEIHPENIELLKKMGNVLLLQWEIEKAIKYYRKAFDRKKDDIEVVAILAQGYFELKNFKKCLRFVKLFLKDKTRDVEKLCMKGYCLEKDSLISEAIECYQKILEIQPYNMEIKERIEKLTV